MGNFEKGLENMIERIVSNIHLDYTERFDWKIESDNDKCLLSVRQSFVPSVGMILTIKDHNPYENDYIVTEVKFDTEQKHREYSYYNDDHSLNSVEIHVKVKRLSSNEK